jgi:hypothetical protein
LVTLTAGGRSQIRAIDAGSGYLCQMEPVAHFGLGADSQVETVEVRWLDGKSLKFENLAADQTLQAPYPM